MGNIDNAKFLEYIPWGKNNTEKHLKKDQKRPENYYTGKGETKWCILEMPNQEIKDHRKIRI